MKLRDLLIRTYPRRWRNEFGPELAGILANKEMTPAVVSDVLASAALQHLRQDPWKVCAVGLAVWTSALLILAVEGLLSRPAFLWCYAAGQLFVFAAGAWTALGHDSRTWPATSASLKAAVLPIVALVVVCSFSMLHYWGSSRDIYGHGITYWIWKDIVVSVAGSLLFGSAGAWSARAVNHLRRTPRSTG